MPWPFTVIGWDLERFDPLYVIERIREAGNHGINTIALSHDIVMNAQEILYDWHRYKYLKRFCDEAHSQGIRVYFWNHQINNPPEDLISINEDGSAVLNFDHPKLWHWLYMVYQKVVDKVPNFDGIILTLTESEWQIHRGLEDPRFYQRRRRVLSNLGPDERMAKVINTIRDSLAERGKGLLVRDFLRSPREMEFFVEALESVPNDVGVYTKCVPNDWQYKYPPHPLLGRFPNRIQVMEMDLYNETGGNLNSILLAPDYYKKQILLAKELGLAGIIPRLDDTYRTNKGTAREFNTFVYNKLIHDPNIDVEPLWMEFFEPYYGNEQAVEIAVDCLKKTFDLVCANVYTLGFWTGYRAPRIKYTDSHLKNHSTVLWSDDPKYKDIETLLKQGGPAAVERTVAEKLQAEFGAAECLEKLVSNRAYFSNDKFLEITGYFEELVQSARIGQLWAKAYFSFRYFRNNPKDLTGRTDVLAAFQEIVDFIVTELHEPVSLYESTLEREELVNFFFGNLPVFAQELVEAIAQCD